MFKKVIGKLSVITIILANLIPIYGILFGHWSIARLLLLYLYESGIIGLFNVLKIWFVKNAEKNFLDKKSAIFIFIMIFCIFMIMQYGGLELIFWWFSFKIEYSEIFLDFSLLSLFLSHAISFISNYIKGREYESAIISNLFIEPFPRILILQFTIILGAYFSYTLGNLRVMIVVFIALKIIFDILMHINYHKKTWQLNGLL